jgi:hypothetical protein
MYSAIQSVLSGARDLYRANPLAFDLLATAAIAKMPAPGSKILSFRTWYGWLYDTAHQYVNTTPRPSLPASQESPDAES